MIEALLLLAQDVQVRPVLPELPKLTPELLTKPIVQFDCRLIGRSGNAFSMVWQSVGPRGYHEDSKSSAGELAVNRTKYSAHVVSDEAGRLSAMRYERFGKYHQLGSIFTDDFDNRAVVQHFRDNGTPYGSLAIYFYKEGAPDPEVFAGPCDVVEIKQEPLETPPENSQ